MRDNRNCNKFESFPHLSSTFQGNKRLTGLPLERIRTILLGLLLSSRLRDGLVYTLIPLMLRAPTHWSPIVGPSTIGPARGPVLVTRAANPVRGILTLSAAVVISPVALFWFVHASLSRSSATSLESAVFSSRNLGMTLSDSLMRRISCVKSATSCWREELLQVKQ